MVLAWGRGGGTGKKVRGRGRLFSLKTLFLFFYNVQLYISDKTGLKVVHESPARKSIQFVKTKVLVPMDGKEIEHQDAYTLVADPDKQTITITGNIRDRKTNLIKFTLSIRTP